MSAVTVHSRQAKSILSKASGFIDTFDFTLNPYAGCAFGCTYCYAAFFAPTQEQQEQWGQWVDVKENALDLLRKKRKRPLIEQSIYMSSVTDPYQPVERKLELTRSILEEMLRYHRIRLVIQTRSPLVTRDLDLLRQFEHVRVNMTITTDDETVRRAFEPLCASNPQRMEAVSELSDAGINTCVALTPLLPVHDPVSFAHALRETGARRFVIQHFHATKSRFVAGTGEQARRLLLERGWTEAHYEEVKRVMGGILPNLYEGKPGFKPDWDAPEWKWLERDEAQDG
ncbi:MAG TPA: radical SAM protein [Phototrophicaceae bacterium]|jgi:DNA repair photolyase|nr:radical SAM protein [Phototrophicaceae bacterium]